MNQNKNDDRGEILIYDGRFKVLPPITDPEERRRVQEKNAALLEKYKRELPEIMKERAKSDV